MSNSIQNGALQTVRVYLSPNENFKLYITLIQHDKKRYMIDAMLGYKNQFVSKNYQETRYLLETIGLFAHRFELDWLYRRTWTPKSETLGHFGKGYF